MANKEFQKMIELGLWLESFLSPKIGKWEYRELAKNAIDLYNIDLDYEDLSFAVTDTLCELPIEKQIALTDKRFFRKIWRVSQIELFGGWDKVQEEDDLNHIADSVTSEEYHRIIKEEKLAIDWIQKVIFHAGYMSSKMDHLIFKRNIEVVLKEIFLKKEPWDIILYEGLIPEPYEVKKGLHTVLGHLPPAEAIYKQSKKIFEAVSLDSGKAKKTTIISDDLYVTAQRRGEPKGYAFPWGAVSSKFLIDFLFLGGQNYFTFCEQCGRFTAIQRKGRKKFCSDICRTTYGNEQRLKII